MTSDISDTDLTAMAKTTAKVYERNAKTYAQRRSHTLSEKDWLDRFLALIPAGGHILDLGCGPGEPIAGYFLSEGYQVTGLDVAQGMLEIARARLPQGRWLRGDMRGLDLAERFDGIIGWTSFFHLTPAEQRRTLALIAAHLKPGGALLLTVGPQAGEVAGHVYDDTIYHASLSPEEYESQLAGHGIVVRAFVPEDPACDFMTLLLAQKTAASGVQKSLTYGRKTGPAEGQL